MSFGLCGCTYGAMVFAGLLGRTLGAASSGLGLQVFIAGKEYTGALDLRSIKISENLGERNDASFQLKQRDLSQAPRFRVGEVVRILRNGALDFAGTIEKVNEDVPGESGAIFISLRCVDFNALADRHVVATKFAVPGQTLRDVVSQILNVFSGDTGEKLGWTDVANKTGGDGVEIDGNSVQTGPELGTIVFNYQTVREAFDQLAELTGFFWNIDYRKVLYFVERTTFRAPYKLDPNSWQGYFNEEVERERGRYRNIQVLRAGKDETAPESLVDRFKGDGDTQSFTLRLEVAVPKVGGVDKPPKVEVDTGGGFLVKTVGIREKDKNKDFYYAVGEKEISQDTAGTKLSATDVLRVTYTGQFPIILIGKNDKEIRSRAAIEQSTGTDVGVESDEKLNDSDLAEEKLAALLRRYGRIPNTARFDCYVPGFRSGQLLDVNLPIYGIAGEYLIDKVTLRWRGFDTNGFEVYAYDVNAVEGEFMGGEADFFRRAAAAGRPFTLRENESLEVIRQFSDPFSIDDLLLTSAPLGSVLDDQYSFLTVGGPWVGGRRAKSAFDATPDIYYGASVGKPAFAGVS